MNMEMKITGYPGTSWQVHILRECENCALADTCGWADEAPITDPEGYECRSFRASDAALKMAAELERTAQPAEGR